eukprot:3944448-Pyramimonas_sp.AAC.1
MELNERIYRVSLSLDCHADPTTPARRGADSLSTVARTFLVTVGFSPACASISRCWSRLA